MSDTVSPTESFRDRRAHANTKANLATHPKTRELLQGKGKSKVEVRNHTSHDTNFVHSDITLSLRHHMISQQHTDLAKQHDTDVMPPQDLMGSPKQKIKMLHSPKVFAMFEGGGPQTLQAFRLDGPLHGSPRQVRRPLCLPLFAVLLSLTCCRLHFDEINALDFAASPLGVPRGCAPRSG
jgi:hypothetical protein